ncbi:hypothetical protein N7533_010596 [Penicillium manginii]|uniref:uncharacterized protein n=1 Tax=Penicillium manginii TaxID=203109 RepID=UPI0025492762|nr:uncharacterized protein N7533_010596 [Penicillium manginii]KAJ5743494.1 hypothetical protein N7533_010596 [Penicillium manginii]
MSQSQHSLVYDHYSSSIFGDNPSDNLNFLSADTLYTDTSTSALDPSPTQLLAVLSPPDNLQRVGPLRKQNYVLWTEMANDEFVAWWLQTEFGSRIKRNIFEGRRQAECWKHFHQVAAIKDGAPKVLCKSCDHALHHPGDGHRGTSTMNKHYSSSVNCRKMISQSNDIRKLIRQGAHLAPPKAILTNEDWQERVLTFITSLQLPFQIVEHPQFRALIEASRLTPSIPEIPSSKTIRQRL